MNKSWFHYFVLFCDLIILSRAYAIRYTNIPFNMFHVTLLTKENKPLPTQFKWAIHISLTVPLR